MGKAYDEALWMIQTAKTKLYRAAPGLMMFCLKIGHQLITAAAAGCVDQSQRKTILTHVSQRPPMALTQQFSCLIVCEASTCPCAKTAVSFPSLLKY